MSQIALFADAPRGKPLVISRGANFDTQRKYRYRLWRIWNPDAGVVLWVMCNPSYADDEGDDATIRRTIWFAHAWGYGGILVVNLFALVSTDPLVLYGHPDPVGPSNDAYIREAIAGTGRVIAAWGQHGAYLKRGAVVTQLVAAAGKRLDCLGVTKDGHPKHPVRLAGDLEPVPYEGRS